MDLNFIAQNFGWLTDFLLLLAFVLVLIATRCLFTSHSREELIKVKRPVFVFLTLGLAFLAMAFTLKNIYSVLGKTAFPAAADFFFPFSYLFFVAGFGYFWYNTKSLHRLPNKEIFFFFTTVFLVLLWLYYLFFHLITVASLSWPAKFLVFFYPSAVSLMFILTLIIPARLKAGLICTPLWYFACAIFAYFLGFSLSAYAPYSAYFLLPFLSAFLFLISSVYFVLGALTAQKKFHSSQHQIHHHTIKKLTRAH